jgi:hypothetical protein
MKDSNLYAANEDSSINWSGWIECKHVTILKLEHLVATWRYDASKDLLALFLHERMMNCLLNPHVTFGTLLTIFVMYISLHTVLVWKFLFTKNLEPVCHRGVQWAYSCICFVYLVKRFLVQATLRCSIGNPCLRHLARGNAMY